jgi:phosphoglycolate phosphatase/putative hydrolase of the HAD superfamily
MLHSTTIDWINIKVVIFDVDGTLYTQSKLRKRMLYALLAYYAIRPWRIKEVLMLQSFRTEREKKALTLVSDLENAQYRLCAEKGNFPEKKIREVVNHWMFRFPNQYLAECRYPGIRELFAGLQKSGKKIGIYSDYEAHAKLEAMNLTADLVVSSTDPEIDRLKPDPRGLLYIAEKLNVAVTDCLFIGDRPELDGECAIRAGMPYLIVVKKPFESFDFFTNLTNQLNKSIKPEYTP